jgi:alpha-amylase/alpha-mannosidase (GH57 family)
MLEHHPVGAPSTSKEAPLYLCIHGHFYQPPRENPFTGAIPPEAEAAPFANFNEKITAECYRPNATAGNFDLISYDLGPTLASWLERQHPDVYQTIVEADRHHRERYGAGNALAQTYHHVILPLANRRDKYTQIVWGLQDFRQRYGHEASGMWLPETAVDLESLDLMARCGVRYTILAPWQAASEVDVTEPYRVRLPSGRSMSVFFYNSPLSGGISFDGNATVNADHFASAYLPAHVVPQKVESGRPQLLLIATDGELYGHHWTWRDMFLTRLLQHSARAAGFELCTLERYLALHPPLREVELQTPSAWSCFHGVERWSGGCPCTEGDSAWKAALRRALNRLAAHCDRLFERYASEALFDPWAARNAYLPLRNGWCSAASYWEELGRPAASAAQRRRARLLLEAQYYLQCSFTSCAFFFEDLDRIEPRNSIAFARRTISLVWQALGHDLQAEFLSDLRAAQSWRRPLTGEDLYRSLPPVSAGLLPPLPAIQPETHLPPETEDVA